MIAIKYNFDLYQPGFHYYANQKIFGKNKMPCNCKAFSWNKNQRNTY